VFLTRQIRSNLLVVVALVALGFAITFAVVFAAGAAFAATVLRGAIAIEIEIRFDWLLCGKCAYKWWIGGYVKWNGCM
jgi:hypothetical protein